MSLVIKIMILVLGFWRIPKYVLYYIFTVNFDVLKISTTKKLAQNVILTFSNNLFS